MHSSNEFQRFIYEEWIRFARMNDTPGPPLKEVWVYVLAEAEKLYYTYSRFHVAEDQKDREHVMIAPFHDFISDVWKTVHGVFQ